MEFYSPREGDYASQEFFDYWNSVNEQEEQQYYENLAHGQEEQQQVLYFGDINLSEGEARIAKDEDLVAFYQAAYAYMANMQHNQRM